MSLSLEYRLIGTGWAECIVTTDDKSVKVTASYLSDALLSLVEAVLSIAQGTKETHASFYEEPGEYRWVFKQQDEGSVCIQIWEFTDLWSDQPDASGNLIFEIKCPVSILVRAMIICLDNILNTYGFEKYKEKWLEHDFPEASYKELRKYLGDTP